MSEPCDNDLLCHYLEGMRMAARIVCCYCQREGEPRENPRKKLVHLTYSSNNLATEHECRALAIYEGIEKETKRHEAQSNGK